MPARNKSKARIIKARAHAQAKRKATGGGIGPGRDYYHAKRRERAAYKPKTQVKHARKHRAAINRSSASYRRAGMKSPHTSRR